MTISFTQALLMFTITQIPLYLLMLIITEKRSSVSVREPLRRRSSCALINLLDKVSFIVLSLGFVLTLLTNFRETIPYFTILSLVLLMNTLYIILRGSSGLILGSFILWHLMMYLDKIPSIDIAVGEGSAMVREMRLNDHWDFRWAHNPSYNPIPTVAFIQATLSRITTIDWYSYSLGSIVFLAILVAYDLSIYTLTYTVTGDSRAALISIPLVAITPETAIHQHPYQWSGNALVIIATALLINAIKGIESRINFVTITLLFTGAILAHATGLSYVFLLIVLLLVGLLSNYIHRRGKPRILFGMHRLLFVLTVLLIILVVRSAYTYGYLGYVYPAVKSVFQGLIDLIKEFFTPSEEITEAVHIPLYERAGVPWIQAYVWSYALSIATAYILYSLVKNKSNLLELVLYASCVSFVGIAFIGYGLLKAQGFYWMNRTTYVFIPLVYPLVAKTLTKILEGVTGVFTKAHLIFALLGLALFVVTAPIASQDPNISPIQYARARQSETIPLDISDIIEAEFILKVSERENYYTYSYITYKTGAYRLSRNPAEGAIGIWYPVLTTKLKSAIGLYSFINKLQVSNIEVLTLNEFEYANFNINLIYNSRKNYLYVE
jgi:hypothetical protein